MKSEWSPSTVIMNTYIKHIHSAELLIILIMTNNTAIMTRKSIFSIKQENLVQFVRLWVFH